MNKKTTSKKKVDEYTLQKYIQDKRQERYERERNRFVEENQCLFYCFVPIIFIITYPFVQISKCFQCCCKKVNPL